jgi:hypothetical protein
MQDLSVNESAVHADSVMDGDYAVQIRAHVK